MNSIGNIIGIACNILFPISEETYLGNQNSSIAICTLSNISLLKQLSTSEIMTNVAIIGRLLSENKGIDSLITHVIQNPKISTIVICGNDVWGHKAGHSLLTLYKNGISADGRIINSSSPDPVLTVSLQDVKQFQNQITIIDKIGESNYEEIIKFIKKLV